MLFHVDNYTCVGGWVGRWVGVTANLGKSECHRGVVVAGGKCGEE